MSEYARKPKRRYCAFCKDKVEYIDYKDINMLRKYTTDRGKIKPRRVSGNCAQHQHQVATAVKRAREMALIPYAVPVVSGKVDGKSRR
jgi:small subunit ribosomal protein S18